MVFKYINPKSVQEVLGQYAPINVMYFSEFIEEMMALVNDGTTGDSDTECVEALKGIMDKLLADNLNRKGKAPYDLYNRLDFAIIVDQITVEGRLKFSIKPYFRDRRLELPENKRRVLIHIAHSYKGNSKWIITAPLQLLMKGYPTIIDSHSGYSHNIMVTSKGVDVEGTYPMSIENFYIGITKRNWLTRMGEHFNEINSGSNKLFHKQWRELEGNSNVTLSSELITTNHTFEQIMAWEEEQVDAKMVEGTSMNMIPGGFKGLAFLHKHNLLGKYSKRHPISLGDREIAIRKYMVSHPRAGIPNLIISDLWKDDTYAQSVICGVEGRLSIDQVRKIRELDGLEFPAAEIVDLVSAKNLKQVSRVLNGSTYSRIK